MFDYSRKLAKEEVLVALQIDGCGELYSGLGDEMQSTSDRYGFTYSNADLSLCKNPNDFTIRHLIYISDNTDINDILIKQAKLFEQFKSISIGVIYQFRSKILNYCFL